MFSFGLFNDGAELSYWEQRLAALHPAWSDEQVLNMSVNYTLNPDVDHDNITDGKEIKGYKVKIINGWKKDGTPISEMRHISPDELDPLTPYTNSNGVLLDTDRDGIPDVVEAWFSNSSIATSSDYQDKFKSKFGDALFNQYAWVINYYNTIKNKEN